MFFTGIQCNPGLRFAHNFFSLSLSFLVLLFLSMVGPQDRTSGNTLVVGDVKQPNTSQLQASKIHPRDVSVNWSLWCDEQLNTDSVKMNSSMLRIVWNQWWENVLCNTHSVTKDKGQSIHFSFLFFCIRVEQLTDLNSTPDDLNFWVGEPVIWIQGGR